MKYLQASIGVEPMKRFREWMIPELLREPDELKRAMIYQFAMSGNLSFHLLIFFFVPLLLLAIALDHRTRLRLNLPPEVYTPLFVVWTCAVILGWVFLCLRLIRPQVRLIARNWLAVNGVPICMWCGYDLTGISSEKCPECGGIVTNDYVMTYHRRGQVKLPLPGPEGESADSQKLR